MSNVLVRDRLLARLSEMGAAPDYQRLAAEVLGIRNAPPALARTLVSQALVFEDRRDAWEDLGARVCARAPETPGVYVLRDANGGALYVGKANNLRRRLRTHFARRRWKALKAPLTRAVDADWLEVGSELEALLREAALIEELEPVVNVQTGPPQLDTRALPAALTRDVIVILPSVEANAAEVVCAGADGSCMILRTRRDGRELKTHAARISRFFFSPLARSRRSLPPLAPIVFSWLAGRGDQATRLDPHDATSRRDVRARLERVLADEQLFTERIVVR
jgi:predicted GIY-YIG superfamily endonuclease